MTTVTLCDGLEEIEALAFYECLALHEIDITSAVKTIKYEAITNCYELMTVTVTLGSGLKEIGGACGRVFICCRSIVRIVVPNSIKVIKYEAFKCCPGLTTVAPRQWSEGDWEGGIRKMHIARAHHQTPR